MSHQQHATQRPTIKEGRQFLAKDRSPVTSNPDDYVTTPIRASDNGTVGLHLEIEFGAASEVAVRPEISNDGGVTFYTRSAFRTFDANGRGQQVPDEIVYKQADWSGLISGGVLRVATPMFLIPDGHVMRFKAFADTPDASTQMKTLSLGGRGL